MPRCTFYTSQFTQCTRHGNDGTDYCASHVGKAERLGLRPERTCPCVVNNNRWCGRALEVGQDICAVHAARITQRIERRAEEQVQRAEAQLMVAQIVQGFMAEEPRRHWRAVTDIMVGRSRLPAGHPEALRLMPAMNAARRFYMLNAGPEDMMENVFINQWLGIPEEDVAPAAPAAPAPAMGQMGRLAADGQNVHTTAVSTQTNSNVDLLLADPPENLDTLRCIAGWWLTKQRRDFEEVWRVLEDVRHWYNKRTCRKTNDNLYKRVLDGLVMKVLMATDDTAQPDKAKQTELYDELIQRVWEECSEAVGMCCEGHISRLANVLVGFDESFRPPVAVGELLQQKMAAIAELKVSTRHKLQRAMDVLEELRIPVEERAPWLEALEE